MAASAAVAIRDEKRALLDRLVAQRDAIVALAELLLEIEAKFTPPVLPITRVLNSRMFYRNYRSKNTPDPFAFLVAFVKTRTPEKYPEKFMASAIKWLTEDPEAFPTLGMALSSMGKIAVRKKYTTLHGAGGGYFVDGREVRRVDKDEVEGEAKKFGISPEELIDQIRYYCAFYRIRYGAAVIYREYIGYLTFENGKWVIHPDWGHTRVSPEEPLIPEAPRPEGLEL